MQKTISPHLPIELPNTFSLPESNAPVHDISFKNAVISFYNGKEPLPKVIFTCEHSSNALPAKSKYKWSPHDKKNFANKHWAQDIGALRLAHGFAEAFHTAICWAKYSRLLCDTNRTPGLSTMFRKKGDGKKVQLNKGSGYK